MSGSRLVATGGAGNVSGPGSSTDRAITTWNSTGGTLLRNNGNVTIDAGGNITTTNKIIASNVGNITPTNFDGNSTHVLLGNGTFGVSPAGGGGALTLITETVISGNATASVTFSSIPSSYRDLEVRVRGRGDNSSTSIEIYCQVNGDTGSHYAYEVENRFGEAHSTSSTFIRIGDLPAASGTADYDGGMLFHVYNYVGTARYREFSGFTSLMDNGTMYQNHYSGWWQDKTTAINALKVYPKAGNYTDTTVVSLYGRN